MVAGKPIKIDEKGARKGWGGLASRWGLWRGRDRGRFISYLACCWICATHVGLGARSEQVNRRWGEEKMNMGVQFSRVTEVRKDCLCIKREKTTYLCFSLISEDLGSMYTHHICMSSHTHTHAHTHTHTCTNAHSAHLFWYELQPTTLQPKGEPFWREYLWRPSTEINGCTRMIRWT